MKLFRRKKQKEKKDRKEDTDSVGFSNLRKTMPNNKSFKEESLFGVQMYSQEKKKKGSSKKKFNFLKTRGGIQISTIDLNGDFFQALVNDPNEVKFMSKHADEEEVAANLPKVIDDHTLKLFLEQKQEVEKFDYYRGFDDKVLRKIILAFYKNDSRSTTLERRETMNFLNRFIEKEYDEIGMNELLRVESILSEYSIRYVNFFITEVDGKSGITKIGEMLEKKFLRKLKSHSNEIYDLSTIDQRFITSMINILKSCIRSELGYEAVSNRPHILCSLFFSLNAFKSKFQIGLRCKVLELLSFIIVYQNEKGINNMLTALDEYEKKHCPKPLNMFTEFIEGIINSNSMGYLKYTVQFLNGLLSRCPNSKKRRLLDHLNDAGVKEIFKIFNLEKLAPGNMKSQILIFRNLIDFVGRINNSLNTLIDQMTRENSIEVIELMIKIFDDIKENGETKIKYYRGALTVDDGCVVEISDEQEGEYSDNDESEEIFEQKFTTEIGIQATSGLLLSNDDLQEKKETKKETKPKPKNKKIQTEKIKIKEEKPNIKNKEIQTEEVKIKDEVKKEKKIEEIKEKPKKVFVKESPIKKQETENLNLNVKAKILKYEVSLSTSQKSTFEGERKKEVKLIEEKVKKNEIKEKVKSVPESKEKISSPKKEEIKIKEGVEIKEKQVHVEKKEKIESETEKKSVKIEEIVKSEVTEKKQESEKEKNDEEIKERVKPEVREKKEKDDEKENKDEKNEEQVKLEDSEKENENEKIEEIVKTEVTEKEESEKEKDVEIEEKVQAEVKEKKQEKSEKEKENVEIEEIVKSEVTEKTEESEKEKKDDIEEKVKPEAKNDEPKQQEENDEPKKQEENKEERKETELKEVESKETENKEVEIEGDSSEKQEKSDEAKEEENKEESEEEDSDSDDESDDDMPPPPPTAEEEPEEIKDLKSTFKKQVDVGKQLHMKPISTKMVKESIFFKAGLTKKAAEVYSESMQNDLAKFMKKNKSVLNEMLKQRKKRTEFVSLLNNPKLSFKGGIILKTIKISAKDIKDSIINFDEDVLRPEIIGRIDSLVPLNFESELKRISQYKGDMSKVDNVSKVFYALSPIENLKDMLSCWQWKNIYHDMTKDIEPSLEEWLSIANTMKKSEKFKTFLKYCLVVANMMQKKDVVVLGFKFKSLEQLIMTKSTKGRSVAIFLIDMIKKKGEQECLTWGEDLTGIERVSNMVIGNFKEDICAVEKEIKKLESLLKKSPYPEYNREMNKFLKKMKSNKDNYDDLLNMIEEEKHELSKLFGEDVSYIEDEFFKDVLKIIREFNEAMLKRKKYKKMDEKRRLREATMMRNEKRQDMLKVVNLHNLQQALENGNIFKKQENKQTSIHRRRKRTGSLLLKKKIKSNRRKNSFVINGGSFGEMVNKK